MPTGAPVLDQCLLARELEQLVPLLCAHATCDHEVARAAWQRMAADPSWSGVVARSGLPLATWRGRLDDTFATHVPCAPPFTVVGVDGSQIYPERHRRSTCFLINTGVASLTYDGARSRAQLSSSPKVFTGTTADVGDGHELWPSADYVNCLRQEYELSIGRAVLGELVEYDRNCRSILLFDGPLIFWNFETHFSVFRERFLPTYCATLEKLCDCRKAYAGYVSCPRTTDLVALLRFSVEDRIPSKTSGVLWPDLIDADIAHFFVRPMFRSQVFKHPSGSYVSYPEAVHPHFFYLETGDEIVRVEIPAWIAENDEHVDDIASLILDNTFKGGGYPVALAEAHEQAVVRSADRELFYHLMHQRDIRHRASTGLSCKELKKRFPCV